MTKREPTCEDCYFRQQSLCALLVPVPCPTFRPVVRGHLVPPRQPKLVPLARTPEPAAA